MDDKNLSFQTGATPVIEPQNRGTVQDVVSPTRPVVSSVQPTQPVASGTNSYPIPSPYESLDGPDETTATGSTAVVSTPAPDNAANPLRQAPLPEKKKFGFRDTDTNKLLMRVIVGALVVMLLLFGAGMISSRLSKNRAVDPVTQLEEQEVTSLSGGTTALGVKTSQNTLLVNGNILTTQSLQVTNGSVYGTIAFEGGVQDQTYTLPDSSGVFCLDSNNCNYLQTEDITIVQTSLNNSVGAITIQGTNDQIGVSRNGNTITLTAAQDIGTGSSPTFNLISLSNESTQNGNTICDSSNNCGYAGGTDAFIQNGNSFGVDAVLGTNDTNPLVFETDGTSRAQFTADGALVLDGAVTDGAFAKLTVPYVTGEGVEVGTDPLSGSPIKTLSLFGSSSDTSNDTVAIVAQSYSNPAIYATSVDGPGIGAVSTNNYGLYGITTGTDTAGVYGWNVGSSGGYGVLGSGQGLFGNGDAIGVGAIGSGGYGLYATSSQTTSAFFQGSSEEVCFFGCTTYTPDDSTVVIQQLEDEIQNLLSVRDSTGDELASFAFDGRLSIGDPFLVISAGITVSHTQSIGGSCPFGCWGIYSTPTFTHNAGIGNVGGVRSEYDVDDGVSVTNGYNLFVGNAALGAGASVANNYGLMVEAQTVGTNDYGIAVQAADTQTLWLSSNANNTTASAGIAFGSDRDTNLYRGAVSQLNTDGGLDIAGHLAVGSGASVSSEHVLNINETYTGNTGGIRGVNVSVTTDPTAASTVSLTGGLFDVNTVAGDANGAAWLVGTQGRVDHEGTGTVDIAYGTYGYIGSGASAGAITSAVGAVGQVDNWSGSTYTNGLGVVGVVKNAGSGTITNPIALVGQVISEGSGTLASAVGLSVQNSLSGTGNITENFGVFVLDPTDTGAGTIDINTGIYVEPQTAGTLDYGISVGVADTQTLLVGADVDGTTANAGIAFGVSRDTNLYRSAADTLKTDDHLEIGNGIASPYMESAPGITSVVDIYETTTNVNLGVGLSTQLEYNPGASAVGGYATVSIASTPATNAQAISNLVADSSAVLHQGSGTVSNAAGVVTQVMNTGAGDIDTAIGIQILNAYNAGPGAINNQIGLQIESVSSGQDSAVALQIGGAYSATGNAYGITIGDVSADVGDAQAIWLMSDFADSDSGIAFGSTRDTNLYRSAANTLRTDDSLVVSGHAAFGSSSSLDACSFTNCTAPSFVVHTAETLTETALTYNAGNFTEININAASDSSTFFFGNAGYVRTQDSNTANYSGFIVGSYGSAEILGSGIVDAVMGGYGKVSGDPSANITNAYSVFLDTNNITGTVANNYGLFVKAQTAGTADYGIAVEAADTQTLWLSSNADNTTAAAGIAFGSSRDTNLYRSAANTLRTDDSLYVGTDLTVASDISVSSQAQVGSITSTNAQCNVVIGYLNCDNSVEVAETFTGTQLTVGTNNVTAISPTADVTAAAVGNQTYLVLGNGTDTENFTNIYVATKGQAYGATTGIIDELMGVSAGVDSVAVGTITEGYAFSGGVAGSLGTVTTGAGLRIQSASGTIGTNYGILVGAQSAGTTDYGVAIGAADTQTLWLSSNADNTTAAAGIAFGSSRDTNLYRSAANTLRTDDNLIVDLDITANGDLQVVNATVTGTLEVTQAVTFNNTLTVNGHLITGNTSGSTTVAVNTGAAGTGATASISGNDTSGVITVNTGTGAAAGTLATVTFANAYGTAPRVVITPKAVPGGGTFPQYHFDSATTTFDLKAFNALTDSSTYTFTYFIAE